MPEINVRETTTTAGLGSITLDGATENGRTFVSRHPLGAKFPYYIDDRNGNWEHGKGYLSGASTLVREFLIDSSTGSFVNFSADAKQIFESRSNTDLCTPQTVIGATSGNFNIQYPLWFVSYSTAYTARANQMYLHPFTHRYANKFSEWALNVKTASVGAVARMAIYMIDESTGLPTGLPILESGDIDCSVTGLTTSDFSNNTVGGTEPILLPKYFMLGIAFEDSVIKVTSIDWTTQEKTWMGSSANGSFTPIYQGFTLGTPTPAVATMPSIGVMSSRGENVPIGGFA